MLWSALFLYSCTLVWCQGNFPSPSRTFSRLEVLVPDTYRILWTVDDRNITVEVQAATQGWMGFGLSANGAMPQSDVITAWVQDGVTYFQDRFAEERSLPPVDDHQDWYLLEGRETSSFTIIVFTRQLVNCDPKDRDILFDDQQVIYAWNDQDPSSEDTLMRHTTRGNKMVNWMQEPTVQDLPPDAVAFDLRVNNYNLPVIPTVYLETLIALPDKLQQDTHYIVKSEPLIDAANTEVVHHTLVSQCSDRVTTAMDGLTYNLFPPRIPKGLPPTILYDCIYKHVFGWAIGGKDFVVPKDIGVLFGGPGYSKVMMLEVHYDNPNLKAGIVDSSGMRLWLIPTPRLHTAGSIFSGMIFTSTEVIIPPGLKRFYHFGICPTDCLKEIMAEAGVAEIWIYAVTQHAHLAGRSIRTRHFRGGKELPIIQAEKTYDFNFQQTRLLPNRVRVLPGDDIVVECGLETTDRNNTTFGGLQSIDEMCLSFIQYYPYIPKLAYCFSGPPLPKVLETLGFAESNYTWTGFFGFRDVLVRDKNKDQMRPYKQVIQEPDFWTPQKTRSLQHLYTTHQPRYRCGTFESGGLLGPMLLTAKSYIISLPDDNEGLCVTDPILQVSGWNEWGTWSRCSVTCGRGRTSRVRTCYGGSTCTGYRQDRRGCYSRSCPSNIPRVG